MSNVSNVVGIDRGIRFIATTYDSKGKTNFYDGNAIKQKRGYYKALRKELQQVRTPSSRRRLKVIGQRENRWMQDVNHCISKALVESNPNGTLFILEDLTGIRSATEKVKVKDRYVSVSWSYYDLEQKLTYKALKNHQLVKRLILLIQVKLVLNVDIQKKQIVTSIIIFSVVKLVATSPMMTVLEQ